MHYLLVLAVVLIEVGVTLAWFAPYYRFGIPVFRRSVRLEEAPVVDAEELTGIFRGSWVPPIVFRRFADGTLLFREGFALTVTSYTPVMRGVLSYDEETRTLVVTGRVNWSVLAFVAVTAFTLPHTQTFLFMGALLLVLYTVQAWRYSRVLAVAAQSDPVKLGFPAPW
jgi:hypothetical protein